MAVFNKLWCYLVVLTIIPGSISAQSFHISGFVIDQSNGEPLLVASAVIDGTDRGATTNLDGFFVINHVEPGTYALIVSYLGYMSRTVELDLRSQLEKPLLIELEPTALALKTVEVRLKREDVKDFRTSPTVSTMDVDAKVIRAMPSLGGEMDVMRA